MNTYSRILFVCAGNTCRGPMAATIMQQFVQDMGILTDSRGMVVLFPEPYNPKAVAVCAGHGMIMPSNSAAQLENTDFDNNTLVLVMNQSMKQKIYESYDRVCSIIWKPSAKITSAEASFVTMSSGLYKISSAISFNEYTAVYALRLLICVSAR